MNTQEKLAAELSVVYPEIIDRIEKKMSEVLVIMGADSFEGIFLDLHPSQRTQTCTKFFQYFATRAIEEVCEENDIPLKAVDETGRDWIYDGHLPVEQKIKTMLVNTDPYRKYNVKKYGGVNTYWTGAKSTVSNNKKADTHLLLAFAINGNRIDLSFSTAVSLKKTGSEWSTGSGSSDGFANLTINNHTTGSDLIYGGYHSTNKSFYGLLQEVH